MARGTLGARNLKIHERRQRIMELRKAGLTYIDISRALGVSYEIVRKDVQRATAAIHEDLKETAREFVALALNRTEQMLRTVYPKAIGRPAVGTEGQPGYKPAVEPNLHAVDRVLAIVAQQSKILGLESSTLKHVGGDGGAIKVEDARSQFAKAVEKLVAGDEAARKIAADLGVEPGGGGSPPV